MGFLKKKKKKTREKYPKHYGARLILKWPQNSDYCNTKCSFFHRNKLWEKLFTLVAEIHDDGAERGVKENRSDTYSVVLSLDDLVGFCGLGGHLQPARSSCFKLLYLTHIIEEKRLKTSFIYMLIRVYWPPPAFTINQRLLMLTY